MLVTFSSDAYENLTFFGDIAQRLLQLMGHSGTIPGAVKAKDIEQALTNLQRGLAQQKNQSTSIKEIEDDEEQDIDIATRAVPLIHMLESAAKQQCDILWN